MNFKVNNGMILDIKQDTADSEVIISHQNGTNTDTQYTIPAGEFVMLLNCYRCIKNNDIQDDFINPHGKN